MPHAPAPDPPSALLPSGFFDRPAPEVAPDLVGATLSVGPCGGIVCETEAYTRDDPASHSFRGPTARNRAMFGPPGSAYVYLSYGLHWCLNVVCQSGDAVLLRALEPLEGLAEMRARRGPVADRLLCAGPGRLGQALGIGAAQDGLAFDAPRFGLGPRIAPVTLLVGPRIGISRAAERPWRFGLAGARSLSRRFPAG